MKLFLFTSDRKKYGVKVKTAIAEIAIFYT